MIQLLICVAACRAFGVFQRCHAQFAVAEGVGLTKSECKTENRVWKWQPSKDQIIRLKSVVSAGADVAPSADSATFVFGMDSGLFAERQPIVRRHHNPPVYIRRPRAGGQHGDNKMNQRMFHPKDAVVPAGSQSLACPAGSWVPRWFTRQVPNRWKVSVVIWEASRRKSLAACWSMPETSALSRVLRSGKRASRCGTPGYLYLRVP